MNIVKQLSMPRHGGIVFINAEAACRRDMTLAIGIMSEDKSELAVLDCRADEVDKLKALLAAGFKPSFIKDKFGNYFVCQEHEVSSVSESVGMNEASVSTDLPNNSVTDPAPVKAKRPVVYKRKVIGMYNEATDELEIDCEYHKDDHEYLLTEPSDDAPYWEIDEDLEQLMAMDQKSVKEPVKKPVTEACNMALATSQFLNY